MNNPWLDINLPQAARATASYKPQKMSSQTTTHQTKEEIYRLSSYLEIEGSGCPVCRVLFGEKAGDDDRKAPAEKDKSLEYKGLEKCLRVVHRAIISPVYGPIKSKHLEKMELVELFEREMFVQSSGAPVFRFELPDGISPSDVFRHVHDMHDVITMSQCMREEYEKNKYRNSAKSIVCAACVVFTAIVGYRYFFVSDQSFF
jgi:hypothetical protein